MLMRTGREQRFASEEQRIEASDEESGIEELPDQHRADVAGRAGDENARVGVSKRSHP